MVAIDASRGLASAVSPPSTPSSRPTRGSTHRPQSRTHLDHAVHRRLDPTRSPPARRGRPTCRSSGLTPQSESDTPHALRRSYRRDEIECRHGEECCAPDRGATSCSETPAGGRCPGARSIHSARGRAAERGAGAGRCAPRAGPASGRCADLRMVQGTDRTEDTRTTTEVVFGGMPAAGLGADARGSVRPGGS